MPGRGGHDGRAFKKGPSLPGMSHVYVPLLRQAVGGWGSGTSRRRRRPGRSSTGLTAVGNGGCGLPMCPTTGPGPPLGGKLPCFPPLPDPHTPPTSNIGRTQHVLLLLTEMCGRLNPWPEGTAGRTATMHAAEAPPPRPAPSHSRYPPPPASTRYHGAQVTQSKAECIITLSKSVCSRRESFDAGRTSGIGTVVRFSPMLIFISKT